MHRTCAMPPAENRRLYRRYPSGLPAELVFDDGTVPARVADISLGGAGLELGGVAADIATGRQVTLCASALADGYPFLAEIRSAMGARLNLSFLLDTDAEFELTMALIGDPITMG